MWHDDDPLGPLLRVDCPEIILDGPASYWPRFDRLIRNNESAIETICRHVSNGGSLTELAATINLNYADIARWIRSDETRNKAYEAALTDRQEWFKDKIISTLKAMGTVDIRRAFDKDGNLLNIKDMPADVARAIGNVKVFEEYQGKGADRERIGETKEVKFVDRISALKLIGQQEADMFIEKREVSGKLSFEEIVAFANEPKEQPEKKA